MSDDKKKRYVNISTVADTKKALEDVTALYEAGKAQWGPVYEILQAQLDAEREKVAGYDRWLSGGVYFTREEYDQHIAHHKQQLDAERQREVVSLYQYKLACRQSEAVDLERQQIRQQFDAERARVAQLTAERDKYYQQAISYEHELYGDPGHGLGVVHQLKELRELVMALPVPRGEVVEEGERVEAEKMRRYLQRLNNAPVESNRQLRDRLTSAEAAAKRDWENGDGTGRHVKPDATDEYTG